MNKTKVLFFILMFSLSGKDIYCQKIFRDGYIVKKTGESLNGLVEYSMNQDIPSVCTFKRFDIAMKVVYSPKEIMAFGYKNGNRYESGELDNKSSFFEVIVTGKIILYRKGSKFYLDKDHSGLVELKNGPVTYSAGGENREFKSLPEFLGFITEGKAGTISDRFNLKNDIVWLITSYNKVSGTSYYVFNRSMSEKQLTQESIESGAFKNKFGIITGINIYTLNMKLNTDILGINTNIFVPFIDKGVSPVTGITYERMISRKSNRFSLILDLLYSRQTSYCYSERITDALGGISRNDAFINYTGLKTPVLLQYSITGRRIVPWVNAGIAYQVIMNSSYLHIEELENWHHVITTSEDNAMEFKTGEVSGVAGLGFRTRIFNNINLSLQARIETGPGFFYNNNKDIANGVQKRPFEQNSFQTTFLFGIIF
jgi:hypothetical protein